MAAPGSERQHAERHCEVVVTPFPPQEARYLALISVVMRDEPGVVARLIGAVAALGINIEVQESSSVNLLDNHFVSLLVDVSESWVFRGAESSLAESSVPSPTAVQRLYRGFDPVFPVHEFSYVRLFESIVAHCADVLVWKKVAGKHLPEIDIRSYAERGLSKSEVRPLVRGDSPLHVSIDLPGGITNRIKQVLGPIERLEYLLVSDTDTRALHAFFMRPEVTARLFHVGFFHNDVPGALAFILALLRDAHFNILTSLVRRLENGRSVWEAVLEYRGKGDIPASGDRPAHSPISQAELEWLRDEMLGDRKGGRQAEPDYAIDIAPPKYPARPRDAEPVEPVSLSEKLVHSPGGTDLPSTNDLSGLLGQRRKDLANPRLDKEDVRRSLELLDLIQQRSDEDSRPVVFLSYPVAATKHGKALEERLKDRYRPDKYQEPNGEAIVEQVISKIEGSDYFIGIWHHDGETSDGERTKHISPWMLFEYGVARAADKPTIVVHSNKLDPAVWQRIDPGISNPEYSDFDFEPTTIDTIWEYCKRNFR